MLLAVVGGRHVGKSFRLATSCAAVLWTAGCGAELSDVDGHNELGELVEPAEPAIEPGNLEDQEAHIHAEVARLGFDVSTLEIDGDILRVEGDIILYREDLLTGQYEPVRHGEHGGADFDDDDVIEKGYRHANLVTLANVRNIDLDLVMHWYWAYRPPAEHFAFWLYYAERLLASMNDWNSIPNSAINMAADRDTSPNKIIVTIVHEAAWSTTPCGSAIACAGFPSNGRPHRNVWVRGTLSNYCTGTWTAEFTQRVLTHELGHTIGFTHPGNGTHVSGTGQCSSNQTSAHCSVFPPYTTVMAGAAAGVCSTNIWLLTPDDRATAARVYPN